LTNALISSAQLYWENKLNFFAAKHVAIPVAVSVFPNEIYAVPTSTRVPKGGHFAAWEQPQTFCE
jgi:hypothetical protein